MRSVPGIALMLALGLGAASAAVTPAWAQPPSAAGLRLPREERTALAALQAALGARDYAAAAAALSAAQAAVHSEEGRYYLTNLQFQYARETNNVPLETSTLDALIANGRTGQAELAQLYALRGTLAVFAGDREPAEKAFTRALELAPTPDTALALAQVKVSLRKNVEALGLIDRAIQMRAATGQPVLESWYKRGIEIAVSADQRPQALRLATQMVVAYPTPENWRDVVLVYRDLNKDALKADPLGTADAVRLLRATKALAGERDYLDAAQVFTAAGLPAEAKAVLAEGVAAQMVDPLKATYKEAIANATRLAAADRPRLASLRAAGAAGAAAAMTAGDHLLSFGDYAGAATFYRKALELGGGDAEAANLQLGIALALAGNVAEAQAPLRAVTGPRSPLAALWLAYAARAA
jgi:tetratricopeptide (TPR) repeat protein